MLNIKKLKSYHFHYIAAICFSIAAMFQIFTLGVQYQESQTKAKIDKCANQVIKTDIYTHEFYKHNFKDDPSQIWNHAEAAVEYQWAKCFREEFDNG